VQDGYNRHWESRNEAMRKRIVARYFAWRWHYADMMIATAREPR